MMNATDFQRSLRRWIVPALQIALAPPYGSPPSPVCLLGCAWPLVLREGGAPIFGVFVLFLYFRRSFYAAINFRASVRQRSILLRMASYSKSNSIAISLKSKPTTQCSQREMRHSGFDLDNKFIACSKSSLSCGEMGFHPADSSTRGHNSSTGKGSSRLAFFYDTCRSFCSAQSDNTISKIPCPFCP